VTAFLRPFLLKDAIDPSKAVLAVPEEPVCCETGTGGGAVGGGGGGAKGAGVGVGKGL